MMKVKLSSGYEIPQIGVGTWMLRDETVRQNVRSHCREEANMFFIR